MLLRRLLLSFFAIAVISVYEVVTVHGQFNIQTQIGVAEVNNKGDGCLTIMNASLQGNDVLNLVYLETPQSFITTEIVKKLPQHCSIKIEIPNASFYSFRVNKTIEKVIGPAIAVTGFNGSFKVEKGEVRADLTGDGSLGSFRECASNEGLHLTVWAGEPLKGKRLWHEYYYLGYDVEPNCFERDYEQ